MQENRTLQKNYPRAVEPLTQTLKDEYQDVRKLQQKPWAR